ncbi:MAG: fatty acid desaturase [Thiotrichales bacterium]
MGFIELPWWGLVLVTLALTHITIASVTIYLHRCQAHRGLDLHPAVSHFMRFWLWLTTGMTTKAWVAIHRKHHAKCETAEDPHSPHVFGIQKVLWEGAELYRREAGKAETLARYGHGTPNDWLERHIYDRHSLAGVALMALIDLALFGPIGLTIWAVQMIWIPFWAAGVINGLGHYRGYRNYETADGSTNVSVVGFIIGGEELHNNHHAFPSSARFSMKPWEFDIGWGYIRTLQALGLAKVRRVAPKTVIDTSKTAVDMETVKAVISAKMEVLATYARLVTKPVLQEELAKADATYRQVLKRIRKTLFRHESRIDEPSKATLASALAGNSRLSTVYDYQRQLKAVWEQTYASQEQLRQALQEWCREAEATGIRYLEEFAQTLRGYRLHPA